MEDKVRNRVNLPASRGSFTPLNCRTGSQLSLEWRHSCTMPADSTAAGAVPLNLLLDIDGTLAITDRLYLLAFQDLMRPFGYTEVDEAWFEKHVAGKVDAEVFRALLPADSTAEMLEATSRKKDALFVQKAASVGAAIVPGLGGVLQMARSYVENGRPEAKSPASVDTPRLRQGQLKAASSLGQPRPIARHVLGWPAIPALFST